MMVSSEALGNSEAFGRYPVLVRTTDVRHWVDETDVAFTPGAAVIASYGAKGFGCKGTLVPLPS